MSEQEKILDCLVIGAGAAGLTAAIYLARFRRRIAVIDAGSSRLLSIPTSHNYPGFYGGIHGSDLLQRLRAQAEHYHAPVISGAVEHLVKERDGSFTATLGGTGCQAHYVIFATGVVDVELPFPDVKRATATGHLRYCPICDGYEAIGKRVAVIAHGKRGLGEALFVHHFADSVSLFSLDEPMELSEEELARLHATKIRAVHAPVERLTHDDEASNGAMQLHLRDGRSERFDVVYSALGTLPNSGLAQSLGAACDSNGELIVDEHQQSSVDGLYAAGDIVSALNQITVAMGHAAIAATAIHNRLRD